MKGSLFFLIGSIATIWGVKTFLSAQATEEWPQVEGKVTASEVTRKRTRGGGKGIKQRKTNYTAEISYDYVIDGEALSSDRFSYGNYSSSNRENADSIVAEFPVGKTVPVFYDPENPESAVLKMGGNFLTYLPLGIGSVFALVGGVVAIRGFLGFRKS